MCEALERAIDYFGSARAMAAQLGVKPMAVTQWRRRGIPVERTLEIELHTNGAVTREELRPDIFGPRPDADANNTEVVEHVREP